MPRRPQPSRIQPPSLTAAVLCCVLCPLSTTSTTAEESIQPIASTGYRVSLFHFYQQNYFDAITELMVAQDKQELAGHVEDAELLRGGMALSYGMDELAEGIFQNLLHDAGEDIDRDRAWFYLGKMAWQKGDRERASQSLAQIDSDYDGDRLEESLYLRGAVDLQQGNAGAALAALGQLPDDSSWHYYLQYNLGADHAMRADWDGASSYFTRFTAMEAHSPESRALRDKGLTAAGYAHLSAGNPNAAREAFRGVSLRGPVSERALLGLGWSSLELGEYAEALAPWQELANRPAVNESARESLLALPYAYLKLDRPGLALGMYRAAAETYTQELQSLAAAVEAFRSEPLTDLLGIEAAQSSDWFFATEIIPRNDNTLYLKHLASRHDFQLASRELRDLYNIAGQLARAEERLAVLTHVDAHQQEVWRELKETGRREALATRVKELNNASQAVQAKLARAIVQGDGRLLAGSEQTASWARLDRAAALSAQLQAGADSENKLRLMHGLMVWADNEAYPALAWQARREQQQLDELTRQSERALAQVDSAIAAKRESNFSGRIAALKARVAEESMVVASAIQHSERNLRQIAAAELEHQAQQVARALGQSNLAIAQLYDQGATEARYAP